MASAARFGSFRFLVERLVVHGLQKQKSMFLAFVGNRNRNIKFLIKRLFWSIVVHMIHNMSHFSFVLNLLKSMTTKLCHYGLFYLLMVVDWSQQVEEVLCCCRGDLVARWWVGSACWARLATGTAKETSGRRSVTLRSGPAKSQAVGLKGGQNWFHTGKNLNLKIII